MRRSIVVSAAMLCCVACHRGPSSGGGPGCPEGPLTYGPPAAQIHIDTLALDGGALYVNGERRFLKTAVHLSNYATTDFSDGSLINIMREKGYSNWKMDLYWSQFDQNGDGVVDADLSKLKSALATARAKGIYVDLAFETYNYGGAAMPDGFFALHPDAQAKTSTLAPAVDNEWNPSAKLPSIFHPAYLQASHGFIKGVLSALSAEDRSGILYYETSVEPQYAALDALDYSDAARTAFTSFCQSHTGCPAWPPPEDDAVWNQFRAESLAGWVNGDADVIRSAVGPEALIAVDYLETGDTDPQKPMRHRNGDSLTFLSALSGVNILQINWNWYPPQHQPFDLAYQNARSLQAQKGWALSEHQTIAADWMTDKDVPALLDHSLESGNRFGWELVNFANNDKDSFVLYHSDWSPKPAVAGFDCAHDTYMAKAYAK